jgi:hypothetical protein
MFTLRKMVLVRGAASKYSDRLGRLVLVQLVDWQDDRCCLPKRRYRRTLSASLVNVVSYAGSEAAHHFMVCIIKFYQDSVIKTSLGVTCAMCHSWTVRYRISYHEYWRCSARF